MNSKLHTSSLLRVGLLIGANRIGGAERQVLLLAKGLSHAGIPVTVFFMDTPPLFRNEIKYDFGEVECKYLWNNCYTKLLSVKYFANCLKRRKISILHMFLPDTMKYGMIGAHMAGIKHTVGSVFKQILQGFSPYFNSHISRMVDKFIFLLHHLDSIISLCLSQYLGESI